MNKASKLKTSFPSELSTSLNRYPEQNILQAISQCSLRLGVVEEGKSFLSAVTTRCFHNAIAFPQMIGGFKKLPIAKLLLYLIHSWLPGCQAGAARSLCSFSLLVSLWALCIYLQHMTCFDTDVLIKLHLKIIQTEAQSFMHGLYSICVMNIFQPRPDSCKWHCNLQVY